MTTEVKESEKTKNKIKEKMSQMCWVQVVIKDTVAIESLGNEKLVQVILQQSWGSASTFELKF